MSADGRDHVGTIANGSETKCPQVSLPLSHSLAEAAVKMDKKLHPVRLYAYIAYEYLDGGITVLEK